MEKDNKHIYLNFSNVREKKLPDDIEFICKYIGSARKVLIEAIEFLESNCNGVEGLVDVFRRIEERLEISLEELNG